MGGKRQRGKKSRKRYEGKRNQRREWEKRRRVASKGEE